MFIGTPHRGSSYATWGVIASNLAKLAFQDTDKRIIETLAIDNEILDNIHDGFLELLHRSNIKIHSFQEGRAMTGVTGLRSKVSSSFYTCNRSSLDPLLIYMLLLGSRRFLFESWRTSV